MKRRTPPTYLTEAFRESGLRSFRLSGPAENGEALPLRLYDGGPACWLKGLDPLDRPCSGDLEVFHFIARQRIRNVLRPLLIDARLDADADISMLLRPVAFDPAEVDGLVELAEWDTRNCAPACTGHHRRFDSHATPELTLWAFDVPGCVINFAVDWGLEAEIYRRFEGDVVFTGMKTGEYGPTYMDLRPLRVHLRERREEREREELV